MKFLRPQKSSKHTIVWGKRRKGVRCNFKYNCMKEYDYIWRKSVLYRILKMVMDYVRGKGSHPFKKIYNTIQNAVIFEI